MTHHEAIEKVRKLLALSESDNEHESASALGRAQAIMEKFRIDAAILATNDGEESEPIEQWEDPLEGNSRAAWRGLLAMGLSKANGCSVFKSQGGLTIVGSATNAGTVRYLYAYCVREVDRLASQKRGNGRTWLNNYRHGCVDAIKTAIREERDVVRSKLREEAVSETGSALMVIDNALAAIDQESVDSTSYMNSRNNLHSVSSNSAYDPGARDAGRRDGVTIYPGANSRTAVGAGTKRLN